MYNFTVNPVGKSDPRFSRYVKSKPNHCPHCHNAIEAIELYSIHNDDKDGKNDADRVDYFQTCFVCPTKTCFKMFIGNYVKIAGNNYELKDVSIGTLINTETYDDRLKKLSPDFVDIYNQADYAEQMKYDKITGIAYRKSLEFLIKDYAIFEHKNDETIIKGMPLQKCINEYIKSEKINKIATAAAWLGNDEAHYIKKWEEKDIEDLKKLIKACAYYITTELFTDDTLTDMKLLNAQDA